MLIKFNILWIDDDEKYITTTSKALKSYLDRLGFHLNVDKITAPQKDVIESQLQNTSQYDLILVDWKCDRTANGHAQPVGGEIIEHIKSRLTFADIIFYSGDPEFERDFQERNLQGVYIADRSELREEAKELIDHLLHKTLHPKIMRGIIVSELSAIDDMCYKIIIEKYNNTSDNPSDFALSIRESLQTQEERKREAKDTLFNKDDDQFIQAIHSTIDFPSHKRALTIKKLATQDNLEEEDLNNLKQLPETIEKRNKLAHWKRAEETDTYIKLEATGKPDYIFNQEEATKVRKSINKAATSLQKYLESLTDAH